jgi:hypothetical protein
MPKHKLFTIGVFLYAGIAVVLSIVVIQKQVSALDSDVVTLARQQSMEQLVYLGDRRVQLAIDNDEREFSNYPAEDRLYSKPVSVDFSSHPEAGEYKTKIIEGAAKGPNYNGHYTVVSFWTTNSQSYLTTIIDAETGKIMEYNFPSPTGVVFRLDSSLIIDSPIWHLPGTGDSGAKYYTLKDGHLELISQKPRNDYRYLSGTK